MAYGRRYRRRLGGGSGVPGGVMAPFGRPLYPIPFNRKRKYPGVGAAPRLGRRVRTKYARSYTRTMRRRRRRNKSGGGSGTLGFSTCIKRWRRQRLGHLGKLLGKRVAYTNGTVRCTADSGRQGVSSLGGLWTVADLRAVRDAETSTPSITSKFFLRNARIKYTIKNQTNTRCKLRIFDFLAKRQTPSTNPSNPAQMWFASISDHGDTSAYNYVGASPYYSDEVNKYFRIIKSTTVDLGPGVSHQHTVVSSPMRSFDTTYLEDITGSGYPGYTIWTLAVFYGDLGNGPGGAGTSDATISTFPCKLDVIWEECVSWQALEKASAVRTWQNNLTTVADIEGMGDGDDAEVIHAAS